MSADPSSPPTTSYPSSPPSVSSVLKTSSALPPRDRAWALFCQGHRSHAIGELLHVPERTVRAWIEVEL